MNSSKMKNIIKIGSILSGLLGNISSKANSDIFVVFDSLDKKTKTISSDKADNQAENCPDVYYVDQKDFQKKNLESLVFDDTLEISFFKDWLSYNTFIDLKIVDRAIFNSYKGDFLLKKDSVNKYGQNEYILYMPKNAQIFELPAIIKKVNIATYGEQLPKSASTIEIKHKIEYAIQYLISIKNDTNKDKVQKAVNKYYQLFEQYFPGEKPDIITSNKKVEENYFVAIQKIENNSESVENLEKTFSKSLYKQFFEAFFEMGSDMVGEVGKIKSTIDFDKIKKQLEISRKSGNKDLISKKESEIVSKILFELNSFYNKNSKNKRSTEFEMSIPSEIVKSDMMNCLGLAIIGHELFVELGIDHSPRLMIAHIALSVKLSNGKEFLFDPKSSPILDGIEVVEKDDNSEYIKVGNSKLFTIKGDQEDALMSSILFNKAQDFVSIKDIKKKIFYMEQAVAFQEKNSMFYHVLSHAYFLDKQYEKALSTIDKATEINPDVGYYRYHKRNILFELKIFDHRYEEAEKMMLK